MTQANRRVSIGQKMMALAAVLLGVATVVTGLRVLTGWDPGYPVFRPLLIFNTAMGPVYLAAGVTAWRSVPMGKRAAGAIVVLNAVVLGAVVVLHSADLGVAVDSVRAMVFRTVVWLLLFLGLAWLGRRSLGADRVT